MSTGEAIYVGDMREDIVAGRRAGVETVAIYREGSYHHKLYLEAEHPTFLIDSLQELLNFVDHSS